MRGNRTWYALAMNWVVIVALVVINKEPFYISVPSGLVIIVSCFIVSGEMKWWKKDVQGLTSTISLARSLAGQLSAWQEAVKNAPEKK